MVVCGLLGLAVGLISVWRGHYSDNYSFTYFLQNLQDLRPITLLMLALGTFAGAYFCQRQGTAGTGRAVRR